MSECALPSIGDMSDLSAGPEQEGVADFDLVAVAGGRAELPVIAGIAPVAEKPEADGNPELNTTASPAVCEGLGRAACAGCPFFRNCFGQQPEAVDKTAPPNYLEELLDEKGPAMVMARPVASKEQPSPPETSAQKQPDTPPSVAPVEELSRLLAPVEEPAVSPEVTVSMVEPKPAVKHESTPPAAESQQAPQPPSVLTESRSVPIEKQAPVSSGEYSTLRPTTPEVDAMATSPEESDRVELQAALQSMSAAFGVASPNLEPITHEVAVEVNIPPIDQSPASVAVAPVEPTSSEFTPRSAPRAIESTVSERVSGDEPQSVPLIEPETASMSLTTALIATQPDLLPQFLIEDEAIGEKCDELLCHVGRDGRDVGQSDMAMPGSETRQSAKISGKELAKQPGVDTVVDEAVDPLVYSQGQGLDTACKQSSVVSKIAVVEEGGIEQPDDVSEAYQTGAGVTVALCSSDVVVKTTMRESADDTAAPFEDSASFCSESIADNSPETEGSSPSDDMSWWSIMLGMVAVFVALQRRQSAVY